MSIHQRWKYVYWFVISSLLGIIIEFFHLFERGAAGSIAVVFTILCLSGVSTYIYKKLPWSLPFIIRIEGEEEHYELD